ncbi:Na+/H+ antiporter NhaA [Georgenia wutianyii]|uniref:Na(+)/H(+) antiporter NhaA n=1 Tax=Georgenia wutianyii TaxID=2585135 RepID=A0ABX5VKU5_9MICO|nr:Na+/H+ antiporter NhaA [Georgenia wutianyii]QDB78311.1 Na+/H+ antiporter NhaA [Georgenia wutianyii]
MPATSLAAALRSPRAGALLLLTAAVLGLIAANSPLGPGLSELQHTYLAVPGTGISLSVGHWISDGLLAVFFFVVAVELRHELTAGELNSVSKALRPAIAAVGGVLVPIAVFLLVTAGSGLEDGWPIPTATDIAFALGVLAVVGRGLPPRLRVFLLALAILDDIIAILIIAVFFTTDPRLGLIAAAAVGTAVFAVLSRFLRGRARVGVGALMVVVALVTWGLVVLSGVHATIAGVALGLVMAARPADRARHALEPFSNGVVLPLFAFSAALVVIPSVPLTELSPAFWGIVLALPLGKVVGIVLGGWLGARFVRADGVTLGPQELLAAGALGGIGFTVSLLMNELAYADAPGIADEGTLAVLVGSGISMLLAVVLVRNLARGYRARAAAAAGPA